jgi:NAD-dependent SIR2 family protein deacetylase
MATVDRQRDALSRAATAIAGADALLVTAGAGMGVDSGLPDFRSAGGFWRAYPRLAELGISFEEMAQPRWFADRPEMAWAFYGHRQQLYRETVPHAGFHTLLRWGESKPGGYFVATSNVDGQFQKAGFPADRVLELHGSIHRLQCTEACSDAIWDAGDTPLDLDIDMATLTARAPLPRCPHCGALARPNVLMFNDVDWSAHVRYAQEAQFARWLGSIRGRRLVIIELGAGTAIATVRMLGERLVAERHPTSLIRVNPDATDEEEPVVPIRLGAAEALQRIEARLSHQSPGS